MDNKDIDKIISNVKATLAIEGLEPSELAQELGRRYLKGEITSDEAIEIIKKYLLNKEF